MFVAFNDIEDALIWAACMQKSISQMTNSVCHRSSLIIQTVTQSQAVAVMLTLSLRFVSKNSNMQHQHMLQHQRKFTNCIIICAICTLYLPFGAHAYTLTHTHTHIHTRCLFICFSCLPSCLIFQFSSVQLGFVHFSVLIICRRAIAFSYPNMLPSFMTSFKFVAFYIYSNNKLIK